MIRMFLLIIFFTTLILSGVALVRFLRKHNVWINRWVFGFASFLIIILPLTFAQNLAKPLLYGLYLISGLFAVIFFEMSRLKVENNEYKGIVRSEQFLKKERTK